MPTGVTGVEALSFEATFGLVLATQNIGAGGPNRFDVYSRTSFAGQGVGDLVGGRANMTDGTQRNVLLSGISGTPRNTLQSARQAIRNGTGNAATREANAQTAAAGYVAAVNTAIWNQLRVANPDREYWNTLPPTGPYPSQAAFLAMTPEQLAADGSFDTFYGVPPPVDIWSLYIRFDWEVRPTWAEVIYPLRFVLTVANQGPIPV